MFYVKVHHSGKGHTFFDNQLHIRAALTLKATVCLHTEYYSLCPIACPSLPIQMAGAYSVANDSAALI